ncbi:hypothetical protein BLIJ_2366 [Bifidobacterium longum subsp. infantis ATCC 15697 = JCM 1222 = DSM 20088]|jgi:hypothetical protein|nr:hypothetical protein BLIJ_2366 [Bifidobacterium longum subsp. infantis ATCC 15697 = JCM 1222 = DSM 20088]
MTGCEKVNLDGHAIEFLQHAGEHMNLLRIGNAKTDYSGIRTVQIGCLRHAEGTV